MTDDTGMEIEGLHLRHRCLTEALAQSYLEAARVCMARHHQPPTSWGVLQDDDSDGAVYKVRWEFPGDAELRGYANADDATRDGAYCLALAAADVELGLTGWLRAEGGSGCDWYLASPGPHDEASLFDLEGLTKLEVSGMSADEPLAIRARIKKKVAQVRRGTKGLPGFAGVVAFKSATIHFREGKANGR